MRRHPIRPMSWNKIYHTISDTVYEWADAVLPNANKLEISSLIFNLVSTVYQTQNSEEQIAGNNDLEISMDKSSEIHNSRIDSSINNELPIYSYRTSSAYADYLSTLPERERHGLPQIFPQESASKAQPVTISNRRTGKDASRNLLGEDSTNPTSTSSVSNQ